jgi:hypothetical protein
MELLAHVHHKVRATGKVRERIDGHLYINISKYIPIEETIEEKAGGSGFKP